MTRTTAEHPNPFDRVTTLVAHALRVPLALVSLVEADRQSFIGMHGSLPGTWADQRETPLSHSFCQHVALTRAPLIITDARQDARVKDNPAITDLNVIAYLGVPLTSADGLTLGSLCAIDQQPREWTQEDVDLLRHLAGFAVAELETTRQETLLEASRSPVRPPESGQSERIRLLVHDLRTPLNNLLLGLKTLPLMGNLNADQREVLELANRGGDALVALVNDLLDVGGASHAADEGINPGMVLRYGSADPATVLTQARAQVAALARERGLAFVAVSAPELPATIEADPERLGRALVNLLANAVKFTPPGGVVTATAQLGPKGETVIFTVRDSGPGVAPADQARIFEPYVVLDEEGSGVGSPRGHSSGLGLAFVKMVAEAHGGTVRLQSQPGEGSAFSLEIPLHGSGANVVPLMRNGSGQPSRVTH